MKRNFCYVVIAMFLTACGASTPNKAEAPRNIAWVYDKVDVCNIYKGQASMLLDSYNWNDTYVYLRKAINEAIKTGNRNCYVGAIAFYVKFNRKFNYEKNLLNFENILSSFNAKEKAIIEKDPDIERVASILNAPKWP